MKNARDGLHQKEQGPFWPGTSLDFCRESSQSPFFLELLSQSIFSEGQMSFSATSIRSWENHRTLFLLRRCLVRTKSKSGRTCWSLCGSFAQIIFMKDFQNENLHYRCRSCYARFDSICIHQGWKCWTMVAAIEPTNLSQQCTYQLRKNSVIAVTAIHRCCWHYLQCLLYCLSSYEYHLPPQANPMG